MIYIYYGADQVLIYNYIVIRKVFAVGIFNQFDDFS